MNTDKRAIYLATTDNQAILDSYRSLTEKIIGSAYCVANTLGTGFLEKVYENALAHELRKARISVSQQQYLPVWYDGIQVGEYYADLLVENQVMVELKAVQTLVAEHHGQCVNYLRATGLHLCLLINFGRPHIDIKRIVI